MILGFPKHHQFSQCHGLTKKNIWQSSTFIDTKVLRNAQNITGHAIYFLEDEPMGK